MVTHMGDLLQECKVIAKGLKTARPSRCLASPGVGLEPPSRGVADTLVDLYFGSFESTYRILHEPTFRAEYHSYWAQPESVPTHVRLRILLVIGIGFSLYTGQDVEAGFRCMVRQWIYAAQTWLSGPLEKDRLTIAGLQIHCLTLLARQIFSIGGDLVWVSVGSLIHGAMQIGLHRDPKHFSEMSVLQVEVRRRLWATILEMVVQSSLDSRMPPRISFDEFDTNSPANINDDEVDESTSSLRPQPGGTYTSTSTQILLLESIPVRLRVLQLLYCFRAEMSYSNVLNLSSELTDACRKCSRFFDQNSRAGATPFRRNLVDLHVRLFLIWLHMPFASEARTNPMFYYSRKVSLDTTLTMITPEPDDCFSRLRVIGGGMFRESIRHASTIILLELLGQVETSA